MTNVALFLLLLSGVIVGAWVGWRAAEACQRMDRELGRFRRDMDVNDEAENSWTL